MDSLKIVDLTRKFYDNVALNHINLEFESKKTYALVGHNGAGKTTLIKHILGLYAITECEQGNILYDNKEISLRDRQKSISYSPELYALFEDLTVIEYINFAVNVYRRKKDKEYLRKMEDKIDELLKMFEIDHMKNKFIYALSNGMKRKVAHIVAFIKWDGFCFLDEPFSALDPVAIYNMKQYIKNHYKEQSYIISTHQLSILDSFDFPNEDLIYIFMSQGNVIFQGTKQQLLEVREVNNIEQAYLSFSRD